MTVGELINVLDSLLALPAETPESGTTYRVFRP